MLEQTKQQIRVLVNEIAQVSRSDVSPDVFQAEFMTRVVRALEAEMRDRFGPPPDEARDFVSFSALRVACTAAKIGCIDEANGRAVLYRAGTRDIAAVVDLKGKSVAARLSELIRACAKKGVFASCGGI